MVASDSAASARSSGCRSTTGVVKQTAAPRCAGSSAAVKDRCDSWASSRRPARAPLIPEWSGAAFGAQADDAAPEDIARASRVTLSEMRVPVLKADLLDPARAAPE